MDRRLHPRPLHACAPTRMCPPFTLLPSSPIPQFSPYTQKYPMRAFALLRSTYLTRRFFVVLTGLVVLYVLAFVFPVLRGVPSLALAVAVGVVAVDAGLLYASGEVEGRRETPKRLSNGDPNPIALTLRSSYPFVLRASVIDEVPVQFQVRDVDVQITIPPEGERTVRYTLRPTERGEYAFGVANVYATTPIGLVERRFQTADEQSVPVYPSYVQMRKYSLMAASNRLEDVGVKKVRRIGHTMEFDHIREYVVGDDYRTVNWKATARRGDLMVNQYRDERSQPVYCLINAGRVMRMPFEEMTLLDYSINASLVLSNIALMKHDKAGVVAFSDEIGPVVPAARRTAQMQSVQEALYRLDTNFLESDYERLAAYVQSSVRGRALLLLFTNFMARSSMERQLPYLQALARRHTLVVIFFQNTELEDRLAREPETVRDVYVDAIAEKFSTEQREITHALKQRGIYTVYTRPQNLSVETINKYLELKARGVV